MDALNIQMILLNVPLLILWIYIFYKSKLNGILIIIGIQVAIMTIKAMELVTGVVVTNGIASYGMIGILTILGYIPLYYYLYEDKMWTLLAILGTLITFGLILNGMGHEAHGDYAIPTLLIVLAWFKTSKRCFNAVTCPLNKLEGRWR